MGWIYSYKAQIMLVMIISVTLMVLILFFIFRNFVGMGVPIVFGILSTTMGLGFIGWSGVNFSPFVIRTGISCGSADGKPLRSDYPSVYRTICRLLR